MTKKMKFASIGDLCVDVYPDKKILGGTSYNSARVARNYGAYVSLISAVGDDHNGQLYRTQLKEQAIDSSYLQTISGQTSSVKITLDTHNSPIFGTWHLGVLGKWQLNEADLHYIKTHDIAKAMCLKPIEKTFQAFCNASMPNTLKVGDFNGDSQYSSFTPEEIAIYSNGLDILVKSLNPKDVDTIQALKKLAKEKKKIILLTLGSKGSICFHNNQTYTQNALKLAITNTTGFGDAYLAVFLITYFQTKNIQRAMQDATLAIRDLLQK